MAVFTYENQGTETLLVCRLSQQEHVDDYAKGMLKSNEMTGILRPAFMQRDLECCLKFPVTSRLPLKDYLQGEMERETVLKLCSSIADAIQEIEDYMLGEEKILLDPSYIYVDIRKKEAALIYLPIDEFSQDLTVKEFMLQMLSHMRYCLEEDVSYVAKLIHFLNQPKAWGCRELHRYIRELLEEPREKQTGEETGELPDRLRENKAKEYLGRGEFADIPVFVPENHAGTRPGEPRPGEPRPDEPRPDEPRPVEPRLVEPRPGEKNKRKGLFGTNKKKAGKKNTVKGGSPAEFSMEIPGVQSAPFAKEGQPEAILNVDEAGHYLSGPIPEEKEGFFHFRKKRERQKIEAESSYGPVSRKEAPAQEIAAGSSAGASTGSSAGTSAGASAEPPKYEPLPMESPQRGGTIYLGHGRSDDTNRTVIIGGGNDFNATMILGAEGAEQKNAPNQVAKIIRRKNGQSKVMNKDLLRIGSEGSFVDFFIGDNPSIGSCHADIFEDNGSYYITDRNSVNHTYVDGIMAQPMQAVHLQSGSRITLADEDFDFIIS